MSDEDDPFDQFDDADREGDPFDELADDQQADSADDAGDAETVNTTSGPEDGAASPDDDADASGRAEAPGGSGAGPGGDDPFADFERPPDASGDADPLDGGSTADSRDQSGAGGDRIPETSREGSAYDAHDVTQPGESEWFDDPTPGREAGDVPDEDSPPDDVTAEPGTPTEPGMATEPGTPSESGTATEPPGDSADAFSRSGDSGADPFASVDSIFERMDVEDLDAESVWEELSDAQERGSVTETRGRTYAEVSKHRYCEQCEYFSPPPEIACTHEDTEILEFLDMETIRVVDCPVVAERKELEDQE